MMLYGWKIEGSKWAYELWIHSSEEIKHKHENLIKTEHKHMNSSWRLLKWSHERIKMEVRRHKIDTNDKSKNKQCHKIIPQES